MSSIEGCVRSALLAMERVKLTDESSRDHGHPELHLHYAKMGRETEDRASPILVGKFPKVPFSARAVEISGQVSAGSTEAFRMGRQRMSAGSKKATAKRWFRLANW